MANEKADNSRSDCRANNDVKKNDDLPGCERLGKILFLRLDPTLRNLLTVLQQHQQLVNVATAASEDSRRELVNRDPIETTDDKAEQPVQSRQQQPYLELEEKILGLLETEARLVQFLQVAVLDFETSILRQKEQVSPSSLPLLKQQLSGSMVIMMDYISLPLVAIFRRPLTSSLHEIQQGQDTTSIRKLRIRQAAERKSTAVAAETLKSCLEVIGNGSINVTQHHNYSSDNSTTGNLSLTATSSSGNVEKLSPQKVLSLILACSSALPAGREITEQSASCFSDSGNKGGLVDSGEDSLESVLNVISILLRMVSTSDDTMITTKSTMLPMEKTTNTCFIKGMEDDNGAFVAHLVDVCVSIVAPPSIFPGSTLLKALVTLHTVMQEVTSAHIWRALFPGCFASLFRTIVVGLRSATQIPQSKPSVILAALKPFSTLLRLTLGNSKPSTAMMEKGRNNISFALANLNLTAMSSSSSSHMQPSDEGKSTGISRGKKKILGDSNASSRNQQQSTTMPDDSSFVSEINNRLPGPLTILAKLLLTASSELIRQAASDLYRVILIESRSVWDKAVLHDLSILALDCCLILSRDTDETVVSSAKSVLGEYIETAFQQDVASILVPRVVSMIQELPTLVERQSETELRNQLMLITALLSLNNGDGKHGSSNKKSLSGKVLRSTLASEDVAIGLRKSLACIFDSEFDSFNSSNQGASIELIDQKNLLLDSAPQFLPRFRKRYLTPAVETEAVQMVQELGRVLGPKHTAVFVDACVADLFQDCVTRVEGGISRAGKSQELWCHEWIGCLSIMRELLTGAFFRAKKELKYLSSLATSILPILLNAPLWNLPLHPGQLLDIEKEPEIVDRGNGYLIAHTQPADSFSSAALRGNEHFLCGVFQIVSTMMRLLADDGPALTPTFLPPFLEIATMSKATFARNEARAALEDMASSLGYRTLGRLVSQNMGVVAGAILAKLRLPGGRSSERGPNEVIAVAYTIRSILEVVLQNEDDTFKMEEIDSPYQHSMSNFTYILELIMTLTDRYDYLASKSSYESETAIAMMGVYESAFRFLVYSYRPEEKAARETSKHSCRVTLKPWLEHLDTFRALRATGAEESRKASEPATSVSPKEGFEAYHREKIDSRDDDDENDIVPQLSKRVSKQEIHFVSMLVSRCTFFLSNSSLRAQIESCSAIAKGFRFLATVAMLCKDPEDSTGTAIRRQVSDAWPAIHARLTALTADIMSTRVSSVVIMQKQNSNASLSSHTIDTSTKRVFYSKILELVTTMAECSSDFIVGRFKNDIFPLVSQLLASFAGDVLPSDIADSLPSCDNLNSTVLRTFDVTENSSTRQASETNLLISILNCFAGVFHESACGRSLTGLIPTAGTLVLPFLGERDTRTAIACIEALKQMVIIDCDALWRPLVLLSGRHFPPTKSWNLPLNRLRDPFEVVHTDADEANAASQLLGLRAREVVDFIENQPEQQLFSF